MTRRYLYNYQTVVSFSAPVTNHSLMLRCQPAGGQYMDICEEHLVLPPGYRMRYGHDAFGNRIVYGGQRDPHPAFAYVSTGVVAMSPYAVAPDRCPMPLWLMPSRLTVLDDGVGVAAGDAAGICRTVHDMIEYAPGATSVTDTAADVMGGGCGVCQDYAHVMIALCRRAGIAARYVCGFLTGTGQTHAWVEVFDGCVWRGFDPTHDVRIDYGYIKLAHGRDAADCPVSRGMYGGGASQHLQVSVTLQEL